MHNIHCVSFDEAKDVLMANMRHNALIPFLGSGFSAGCSSSNGIVPSGSMSKADMLTAIKNKGIYNKSDMEKLQTRNFSGVHETYTKCFSKQERRPYLRDRFTKVRLDTNKKAFLTINWLYIYTLNIDDAIENNSEYRRGILPNQKINDSIYDEEKCIVKLHGDVWDMLTYDDAEAILSRSEYIKSLTNNQSLLGRIEHDMMFQNIIFIGCSLDDEIDLQSVSLKINETSKTNKYFCTDRKNKPEGLALDDLRDYGITHIIVFDSFDKIYTCLYDIWIESKKISKSEVDGYEIKTISQSKDTSFELNKDYLFFGKSLIDSNRHIIFPYFFIERNIANTIQNNMLDNSVQIVIGNGYSGKTYILACIASLYAHKGAYVFSSRDRISDSALDALITKSGLVLFFDTKALTSKQIELILDNRHSIKKHNVYIIIFVDKSDNDVAGYVRLMQQKGKIEAGENILVFVNNHLSKEETENINSLLPKCELGAFNNSSILSNILRISKDLHIASRYSKHKPSFTSCKEIAALVVLATRRMVSALEATRLELLAELAIQVKRTTPLLELEPTWPFEKSASDDSPEKYIVNAERWLEHSLQEYAHQGKSEEISKAYEYLISRIIQVYGPLKSGYRMVSHYKDYILFDNINRIFSGGRKYGKQDIHLIKVIYDKLNELLATEPHYMHQKAKCYIRCSYYESSASDILKYLQKAYRIVNTAKDIFWKIFEDSKNEKTLISYAHTRYTQAVVLCHICRCNKYADANQNLEALHVVYDAFQYESNSYQYAKDDETNYGNAIFGLIKNMIPMSGHLRKDDKYQLESMFNQFSTK